MSENNAFIRLQESANGRVSVKLQKNQFAKDGAENYYGKLSVLPIAHRTFWTPWHLLFLLWTWERLQVF